MCFYKKGSIKKVLDKDLYIIKSGVASKHTFRCEHRSDFVYSHAKLYKKNLFAKIAAYLDPEDLTWTVYHTYDLGKSRYMSTRYEGFSWLGVFKIPAGTTIYINDDMHEIATFAIQYLGPLSDPSLKTLVLNQHT